MNIEDKLMLLHQLENQKTSLKNDLKCLEANIEQAQIEIVEEFDDKQIQHINIKDIGTFYRRTYVAAPKLIDPVTLKEWLEKNSFTWEMVTAFNSKKLQGLYNELLEQGKPLPEGVEPPFTKGIIVLKKGV